MSARILPRLNSPYRAALYGRASSDPKKRGRSIRDQFAVGEVECEDHGWEIVDYYEDRDRSASRRAVKKREHWERLVDDIKAGAIDVLVYAERSRSSRRLDVSMALRELCEDHDVLLCYDGRVYNMKVPSDRKEFTRDAVQSEEEAEAIIGRSQRTARLAAQRGAPHAQVPFGYARRYDPDDGHLLGQFRHPTHAAVVHDLFIRADAGQSVMALREILRQYKPSATTAGVRTLLKNRSYLGIRVHKGKAMTNCLWDPIVDDEDFPDLFDRVQQILADPARKTMRDTRIKHLLSGLAMCAGCLKEGVRPADAGIRATMKYGASRYRCPTPRGHTLAREDAVDALVEAAVFEWLSSSAATAAFQPSHDAEAVARLKGRIEVMKAQIESARELAGQLGDDGLPRLTIESLATTERMLLPQIAKDEEQLQSLTAPDEPLLARLVGEPVDVIAEVWNEQLTMSQRRRVLRSVVNVELRPASARGVQRLTVDRVGLVFAGEPGFERREGRSWVRLSEA